MKLSAPRILIEGIGALGGITAGKLIAAGCSPTLVTGNPDIAAVLRKNGISITIGEQSLNVPVEPRQVFTSLDEIGPGSTFDIVLLLMKAFHLDNAVEKTLRFLHAHSFLVPCQNGMVEEKTAAAAGRERVIGALMNWGGTMHKPGHYELTFDGNIVIGELDGKISERIHQLQKILMNVVTVKVTDNIYGALWSKLALNCTVTAFGALYGKTLSEYLQTETIKREFLDVYREVVDTAHAAGIKLVALNIDPLSLYLPDPWNGPIPQKVSKALDELVKMYGKTRPSLLVSLERGQRTEIDYITGYVAEVAKSLGRTAPHNARITKAIHALGDPLF